MNARYDHDELALAAESTVSAFDDPADDSPMDESYGAPDDFAFEAVGGLGEEHAERAVRDILGRVFGL